MKTTMIICSMCGHTFDPMQHPSCESCPLQTNCTIVCCPRCGFETVNPAQSRLANFAVRFFGLFSSSPRIEEP